MDEQNNELSFSDQLELLKTAHNLLAEATSTYLDKLKSLANTYKREFALMNVAVVVAAHMPGLDGLKLDSGVFDLDAVKATAISGHKDIVKELLAHLTTVSTKK